MTDGPRSLDDVLEENGRLRQAFAAAANRVLQIADELNDAIEGNQEIAASRFVDPLMFVHGDLTSDPCPLGSDDPISVSARWPEPTYILKASDPLAMGLLKVRTALRGHDFRLALKYFEVMVELAAGLPIAPVGDLMGAHELAGDMALWRFQRSDARDQGSEKTSRRVVLGDEDTGANPTVVTYPGPPFRVVP